MSNELQNTYSGFIAIVGRPNVGKSTLLNRLVCQKISITCRKVQTTRHQIKGIRTIDNKQLVFVDTPGLHLQERTILNKFMNNTAKRALHDVNAVIMVVEALKFTAEDELVLSLLPKNCPIILAINKVDTVHPREYLLKDLQKWQKRFIWKDVFPISAKRGKNVPELLENLQTILPIGPHYFNREQITDKTLEFQITEIIREKLTRFLGNELPYKLAVELEKMDSTENHVKLSTVIWVEKIGQKKIIIGKDGISLREIGRAARLSLVSLFMKSVHIELWVKVKRGWSTDIRVLRSLAAVDTFD